MLPRAMARCLGATLLIASLSCSPVSASKEIGDAQTMLNAAEERGAARLAVYEYTAAAEYLHKAREENGYADFEAARVYAARAADLARQALTRATPRGEPYGPQEQTLPDGPSTGAPGEAMVGTPPPPRTPARKP